MSMNKVYHNTKYLNNIFSESQSIIKKDLNYRLSLILLNRPINKDVFIPLYKYATNVICWDGAINRLYNAFSDSERENYHPTHLIGDLDSADPDIINYYSSCEVIKDDDQDTNDFQKAFSYLANLLSENPFLPPAPSEESKLELIEEPSRKHEKIIVLFPFGGRVDQTLSSMHILWRIHQTHSEFMKSADLLMMDQVSTMQFLSKGENVITTSNIQSEKGCGVVPLMGRCTDVKTCGLKWNMGNSKQEFSELEFGEGIISTSNEISEEPVIITTATPLVWTTTLKQFYENSEP